jgi:hypothetical protein
MKKYLVLGVASLSLALAYAPAQAHDEATYFVLGTIVGSALTRHAAPAPRVAYYAPVPQVVYPVQVHYAPVRHVAYYPPPVVVVERYYAPPPRYYAAPKYYAKAARHPHGGPPGHQRRR